MSMSSKPYLCDTYILVQTDNLTSLVTLVDIAELGENSQSAH